MSHITSLDHSRLESGSRLWGGSWHQVNSFSNLQRWFQPSPSCPPLLRRLAVFCDARSRQTVGTVSRQPREIWLIGRNMFCSFSTKLLLNIRHLSLDHLDSVLRCSALRVITHRTPLEDHLHIWHCVTHKSATHKEYTDHLTSRGNDSIQANARNCMLMNACLGKSCCSVCCCCGLESADSVSCKDCHRHPCTHDHN